MAEYYEVPFNEPRAPVNGFTPRGMDIDRDGVVWVPLASGHLGSFDRRKCKGPLNGPSATGRHCPEGWTLYPFPGPQFKDVADSGSAEASYYTWVDQFESSGSARTCRLPPATRPIRCMFWWTASSSKSGYVIATALSRMLRSGA